MTRPNDTRMHDVTDETRAIVDLVLDYSHARLLSEDTPLDKPLPPAELTRLADSLPRLRNYCVAVKEWNDEILFVRRVIPGAADRSYGIQVARLAGLPQAVVDRARQILSDMEGGGAAAAPVASAPAAKPAGDAPVSVERRSRPRRPPPRRSRRARRLRARTGSCLCSESAETRAAKEPFSRAAFRP